ncbi:MAG: CBS domain-containing protein [Bacteroidota bacterium]
MNVAASITSIMSTNLVTVNCKDALGKAKAIFEAHNIHHLPVIDFKTIRGILSKVDLLHFIEGSVRGRGNGLLEETRLRSWKVEEIMNEKLVTLTTDHTIADALDIFKLNQVHCLPILNGENLVGILTPHDFILALANEKEKQQYRNFKVA